MKTTIIKNTETFDICQPVILDDEMDRLSAVPLGDESLVASGAIPENLQRYLDEYEREEMQNHSTEIMAHFFPMSIFYDNGYYVLPDEPVIFSDGSFQREGEDRHPGPLSHLIAEYLQITQQRAQVMIFKFCRDECGSGKSNTALLHFYNAEFELQQCHKIIAAEMGDRIIEAEDLREAMRIIKEENLQPEPEMTPGLEADHWPLAEWAREITGIIDDDLLYTVLAIAGPIARARLEGRRMPNETPIIDTTIQELTLIVPQSLKALRDANSPERLFTFSENPARIEHNDEGRARISIMDKFAYQYEMAKSAHYITYKDKKEKPTRPPMWLVQSAMSSDSMKLPALERIVDVPIFSENGEIISSPGYDKRTKTFYDPDIKLNSIPKSPNKSQLEDAKNIIFEMLHDFQFVNDSDKAHAIGAMFTPYVRSMIPGPVPGLNINSNTAGVGKDLLAYCITYPAAGENVVVVSPANDDTEWRKRIMSAGLQAPAYVIIGNITNLVSAQLAHLLTADTFTDRILGKSELASFPVRFQLIETGINPTYSSELTRRHVQSRITTDRERPWEREDFLHPNLKEWVRYNRPRIVEASLTLVQAWITSGKPEPACKPLGSFESWSRVIGGILENAEIPGFLDNMDAMYEQTDVEGESLKVFILRWHEKYGTTDVKSSDLFEIAQDVDGLPIFGKNEQNMKKSLARLVSSNRERIFGLQIDDATTAQVRIVKAGSRKKTALWCLDIIRKDKLQNDSDTADEFYKDFM